MPFQCIVRISLRLSLGIAIVSSCTPQPAADVAGIQIPYPQPLPDSLPLTFLKGIVSKDSFDFNAAFSPDGKSFYFTRRSNKQSRIFVSHFTGNQWTDPEAAAFTASGHSEADPAFGPDGKLYFISNRPKDPSDASTDYDIWFTIPLPNGNWSTPENFAAINSDSSEFYISFSKNGTLYFASARKGGYGLEDIYVSKLVNNAYIEPQNLGAAINTEKSEYDPCIAEGEDVLIFTSSNRDDTFGAGDLYGSTIDNSSAWLPARNLGKNFNTETREFCAYFSPDSKYFFFSSQGDVKWVTTQALQRQLGKLSQEQANNNKF